MKVITSTHNFRMHRFELEPGFENFTTTISKKKGLRILPQPEEGRERNQHSVNGLRHQAGGPS
jgi:KaiC/GvpD/RAD55 family RecA-like ATPase